MTNESSAEIQQWLSGTAHPLASLVAGHSTEDLAPLGKALAGVRVVGLGEATHGTREFFQLKHRLFEYLVTELGYSVLAMEASESATPAVDAYVRGGAGDAATVVDGLGFWTWRTEEVVALVEWMRSYNSGRPAVEQIGFVGIDPQRCSASVAAVRRFLAESVPDRLAAFEEGFGSLAAAPPGSAPDPERLVVKEAQQLIPFLEAKGASAEVVRHARILERVGDLVSRPKEHKDPAETVFAVRDAYLADAIVWLADEDPSRRIAVWAHNGHLAAGRQSPELRPMGQHLRERFGAEYYAVALLFGSGAFRARRLRPGPWPGPMDGPIVANSIDRGGFNALEGQLAAATPGDHFLDLRGAGEAPEAVRRWLAEPQMFRSFGAYVQRWTYKLHFAPTLLAKEYDGLAYVATSSPSTPLTGEGSGDDG
ncbi:erythromycin esterase family protein [Kribbella sp. CA-293567]|uniref:erythromycin esterase family protein n=1 Tax=Kribbella sp. CA-293567 TaxID=3002436 RepID=UPI0022DD6071|nr:erythromycin esterase family protein [Kribbella sp. CA-293567]WBQ01979.1 erythromycin esterase family protein [Kribbella sp. CA-293567]